jgi:hypothetical protein
MMKEKNIIRIIEDGGYVPELPDGLEHITNVISPFGFKIVNIDNKYFWEVLSEDEYRDSEARRLGILKSDVDIHLTCQSHGSSSCSGTCNVGEGRCKRFHDPYLDRYYCACG